MRKKADDKSTIRLPQEYLDYQNDIKAFCVGGETPLDMDYLYYE